MGCSEFDVFDFLDLSVKKYLSDAVMAPPYLCSSPFWLHFGGRTFPLQLGQQNHLVIIILIYKPPFSRTSYASLSLMSHVASLWLTIYSKINLFYLHH